VLETNVLSVTYAEEEDGFRKSLEIREMILHSFICEELELEIDEENKNKPIHLTNGCTK
jgi:hypothetical protein